jgi:hypothetical protein
MRGRAESSLATWGPRMMLNSPSAETGFPAKLKRDNSFQPCPAESGDEHYQNGIFEFNITRLLAFIDTSAERFPIELVPVDEFPNFGGSHLDEETLRTADLSRPILLAEISPGLYNVIDGHHRLARARCDSVQTIPSRRIRCPDHVFFLTSAWAYEKYVEYWNSKLEDLPHAGASRKRRRASIRI